VLRRIHLQVFRPVFLLFSGLCAARHGVVRTICHLSDWGCSYELDLRCVQRWRSEVRTGEHLELAVLEAHAWEFLYHCHMQVSHTNLRLTSRFHPSSPTAMRSSTDMQPAESVLPFAIFFIMTHTKSCEDTDDDCPEQPHVAQSVKSLASVSGGDSSKARTPQVTARQLPALPGRLETLRLSRQRFVYFRSKF
jgi:hypothetical protein